MTRSSPPDDPPLLRSLPALDLHALSRVHGGDAGRAAEALGAFAEQAALWRRLLDAEAPASQWDRAAAALLSAATAAAALELARACSRAAGLARSDPPPGPAQSAVAVSAVRDALPAALEAAAAARLALEAGEAAESPPHARGVPGARGRFAPARRG